MLGPGHYAVLTFTLIAGHDVARARLPEKANGDLIRRCPSYSGWASDLTYDNNSIIGLLYPRPKAQRGSLLGELTLHNL